MITRSLCERSYYAGKRWRARRLSSVSKQKYFILVVSLMLYQVTKCNSYVKCNGQLCSNKNLPRFLASVPSIFFTILFLYILLFFFLYKKAALKLYSYQLCLEYSKKKKELSILIIIFKIKITVIKSN